MSLPEFTVGSFTSARHRIGKRVHKTPLMISSSLGKRLGCGWWFKCESFQKTGSFKVRGVLNKLLQMDAELLSRGVITISAGNHAQALAFGAQVTGTSCVVVMPQGASAVKAEASRGYGAEVIIHGTAMEAFNKAQELAGERGLTFIHPFDDAAIVEGQGTVALEILEEMSDAEVMVVPVGGGGLIAGMAACARLMNPQIKIYGVEPEGACVMRKSLDKGEAVKLGSVNTIADGLAAPMAGALNFRLVKRYVEDVVVVTDEEIKQAMKEVMMRAKLFIEPAAAAPAAALLQGRIPGISGKKIVSVISGGNCDFERLAAVIQK